MNNPAMIELALTYAPVINDITDALNFVVKLWALSHFIIIKPIQKRVLLWWLQ